MKRTLYLRRGASLWTESWIRIQSLPGTKPWGVHHHRIATFPGREKRCDSRARMTRSCRPALDVWAETGNRAFLCGHPSPGYPRCAQRRRRLIVVAACDDDVLVHCGWRDQRNAGVRKILHHAALDFDKTLRGSEGRFKIILTAPPIFPVFFAYRCDGGNGSEKQTQDSLTKSY